MKRKNALKQYPVLTSLAAALCPAFLLCLISMPSGHILYSFTAAMLIGLFCLYPFVLTALNLFFCFKKYEDPDMKSASRLSPWLWGFCSPFCSCASLISILRQTGPRS